jgi:hypothetical protein
VSDYAPFSGDGRRREPPGPVLITQCWRLLGPSGKPITCGIYRTDAGIEVRCGYSDADLVRSHFASRHRAGHRGGVEAGCDRERIQRSERRTVRLRAFLLVSTLTCRIAALGLCLSTHHT